jgi:hypothetical protein
LADFKGKTLILPDVRVLDEAERAGLTKLVADGRRLVITGKDTPELPASPQIVRFPDRPGAVYMQSLDPNLEKADQQVAARMLGAVPSDSDIQISAAPLLITHIARVNGLPHIFMVNFLGLRGHQNAVPAPESDMTVTIPAAPGVHMYYVPFLGRKMEVRGEPSGNKLVFHVPPVERGGVLWLNPSNQP